MLTVKIDEDKALDLLMDRVAYWTDDKDVQKLYEQMYENYIFSGCFDGIDFDIMSIVDNDCINYCSVICKGDAEYTEIDEIYKKQGLGDCSCEAEKSGCSFIEAEYKGMYLVRY